MGILARALRLPFLPASVLPFVFGSLLARGRFHAVDFLLGLAAVAGTHLSANLLNDYADSKSGADAQDRTYYGFFGGSKLIQEGVLSARFYLTAAMICAAIAFGAVLALALCRGSVRIIALYGAVLLLAWSYSAKPLQFSYRRLGELVVFVLFGPATVMGGYFIQTGEFPTLDGFALSLPFGFLTASILLANEVPDLADDEAAGKFTLVSVVGQGRGFILYAGSVACALAAVVLCFTAGRLGPLALVSLAGLVPAGAAARVLRRTCADKAALVRSSRLAILTQTGVAVVLILDVLL